MQQQSRLQQQLKMFPQPFADAPLIRSPPQIVGRRFPAAILGCSQNGQLPCGRPAGIESFGPTRRSRVLQEAITGELVGITHDRFSRVDVSLSRDLSVSWKSNFNCPIFRKRRLRKHTLGTVSGMTSVLKHSVFLVHLTERLALPELLA